MKMSLYYVLIAMLFLSCASLRKESKPPQKVYLRFLPDVHKVIEEYINHSPDDSYFLMLDKGCDFEANKFYYELTVINAIPNEKDRIIEMYQNANTFLLLNGREIRILHESERAFLLPDFL